MCSFENAEQRLSKKEAEDAEQKQIDEQETRVEDAKKKAEEVAQKKHAATKEQRDANSLANRVAKARRGTFMPTLYYPVESHPYAASEGNDRAVVPSPGFACGLRNDGNCAKTTTIECTRIIISNENLDATMEHIRQELINRIQQIHAACTQVLALAAPFSAALAFPSNSCSDQSIGFPRLGSVG